MDNNDSIIIQEYIEDDNVDDEDETIVESISNELEKIYKITKEFPKPILEKLPNGNSNGAIMIEDWQIYMVKFYRSVLSMSEHLDNLVKILHPVYIEWYRDHSLLPGLVKNLGIDRPTAQIIYGQGCAIRANVEEYFLLAHTHMPSWRIQALTDPIKSTGAQVTNGRKSMEVMFFYVLSRVITVVDVFYRINGIFVYHTESTNTGALNVLKNADILPSNVGKWKFSVDPKYVKNKLMVPYYSQSQLETSFKYLYLKLNLISYHSDIDDYINELMFRMAWLLSCPHDPIVLDIDDFTASITSNPDLIQKSIFSEHLLTQIVSTSFQGSIIRGPSGLPSGAPGPRICNIRFVYRYALRYYYYLQKSSFRTSIFPVERILDPPENIKNMAEWLRTTVRKKFDIVIPNMKTEIGQKHTDLLLPPSDREWIRYSHPFEFVSEASIWSVLYPQLKQWAVETGAQDPRKIFDNPSIGDAALFEFIVVKILHMILPSRFGFLQQFTMDQNGVTLNLDHLKNKREMPMLIQSFNRYTLIKRDPESREMVMYEYPRIFETMAAFIDTMVSMYSTHMATIVLVQGLTEMKKLEQIAQTNKDNGSKEDETKRKMNEFSTLQTRVQETDVETDDHKGFF